MNQQQKTYLMKRANAILLKKQQYYNKQINSLSDATVLKRKAVEAGNYTIQESPSQIVLAIKQRLTNPNNFFIRLDEFMKPYIFYDTDLEEEVRVKRKQFNDQRENLTKAHTSFTDKLILGGEGEDFIKLLEELESL